MQNNQWKMAGDQLLTKCPIELDINSNVVRDRDNSIMNCIVEMIFENIIVGLFVGNEKEVKVNEIWGWPGQGEDAYKTILTWANTATSIQHDQSPTIIGIGTFACGSVIVEGEDFIAQNITFENAAPQGSGQAVAIRVTADRCAFYQCRFLGWQDTAYLHYGKQYFRDCYIEGSVDFIFGNAQVLLEHCHIHCKSAGFITAQSCRSPSESTGYVFLRCVVTGTGAHGAYMHLGRPWQSCAKVIFAFTFMDGCIVPAGWNNWNDKEKEKTACFCEYRCTGPGSNTSHRVPWMTKLTDAQAAQFLSVDFIDPQHTWLTAQHSVSVPYVPIPLSA
jgi:pectinesterase